MSTAATNDGYRLDYWLLRSGVVMRAYDADAEGGHIAEDVLLNEFVEAVAHGLVEDPRGAARVLIRALLGRERKRWFS